MLANGARKGKKWPVRPVKCTASVNIIQTSPSSSTSKLLQHEVPMLTRRVLHCVRTSRQVRSLKQISRNGILQQRSASTASGQAASTVPSQSSASQLAVFTGELDKLSPRFDISADSIQILKSPAEFYETLKVQ